MHLKLLTKKIYLFLKLKILIQILSLNSEKIFEEDIFYIVNIWASWCVPCRTEHPLLMQLSKNQSIKLIGLNYRDN